MKSTTRSGNSMQFVLAIAMALVLGLALVQAAGAQKYAKGTTQASSIQNTKDMCEVGGGTQTVTDSPFEGVKISKCSGGDMDGYTCGHGQKSMNCSYQIVTQPGGTNGTRQTSDAVNLGSVSVNPISTATPVVIPATSK